MPLDKREPGPAGGSCVCGRDLGDAVTCVYRSHGKCHSFHRCECGVEWTEHRTEIDLTGPVSSDEVIEVHVRLARFDWSISELLGRLSA